MFKILVVDDEEKILNVIAMFLRAEHFEVIDAKNGETAIQRTMEEHPDLIILDVMLPDMTGYQVCQRIREFSSCPVIFLTALEEESHQLLGYNVGCDDYIVKPFKPSILTLKVKRILERVSGTEQNLYKFGPLSIDNRTHTCLFNGEKISLTNKEFELLFEFAKNPGVVLTRKYLLKTIWGCHCDIETRVVDVTVNNLRKKLGPQSKLIKTVTSVGYSLDIS